MISKVWMINAILSIVLVICLVNVWDVWHADMQALPEEKSVLNNKDFVAIKKIQENKIRNESAYESVVDKNLFSSDRAPATTVSGAADPEIKEDVRISGEKVVLYGVIMIDDYKKALINNPGGRKTGSKIQWVSEGDKLENLKVQAILEDEILLVDGSDRYRVLLYDPEKAGKSVAKYNSKPEEAAQPQVISAGEKPKAAERKTGKLNKPTEKVSASSDSEYEIVDTPFGKLKRKRK